MSLDSFFTPRSIILVGAAHSEIKLGGIVLKNLLRFRGKVYPVNPKYRELMGLEAYPSVEAIPEPVDLAVIMRPAPEVPEILRELKNKTKSAIIISSGFAEIGETRLQSEVGEVGRESGIRILGPNCMGVLNPKERLDTFFLSYERLRRPKRGNVGIVSQSGAILSCLLSTVRASNMGVSRAVGYGNALDVDEADIYEYFSGDRDTDVVVSYIESVGDGRKFIQRARELSERKPLVILKSGKGVSGQAAAFSHTGRLAGRYEVFHSILKQFGVEEARDFDELMDATKALSYQKKSPRTTGGNGNRILIITNGGGSGVLAADECMRQGLEVPQFSDNRKERLGKIFPHFYGINNPLDLTAQVRDEDYLSSLRELEGDYDAFLIIALPNVLGITERLAGLMRDFRTGSSKPLVFHIPLDGVSRRIVTLLERARIPVYPSPERAVRGLGALLR